MRVATDETEQVESSVAEELLETLEPVAEEPVIVEPEEIVSQEIETVTESDIEPDLSAEPEIELVVETEPESVAESKPELIAEPESIPSSEVVVESVIETEIEPDREPETVAETELEVQAEIEENIPEIAEIEPEIPVSTPAWLQKSDRLEILKETAIETEVPEVPPEPVVQKVGMKFDDDFIWSAKVLADQGRAPEDISEEEINWLSRLRQ